MFVTGASPSLTRNFLAWYTRDENVRMLESDEAMRTWSMEPGTLLPEDPPKAAMLVANTEPVQMARAHMLQAHQWLTDTEHLWERKEAGLLPKVGQTKQNTAEAKELKAKLSKLIAAPETHRTDKVQDLTAK